MMTQNLRHHTRLRSSMKKKRMEVWCGVVGRRRRTASGGLSCKQNESSVGRNQVWDKFSERKAHKGAQISLPDRNRELLKRKMTFARTALCSRPFCRKIVKARPRRTPRRSWLAKNASSWRKTIWETKPETKSETHNNNTYTQASVPTQECNPITPKSVKKITQHNGTKHTQHSHTHNK